MDRRHFVVRSLAAVPFLSGLVAARRPFKETTMVTVTHDGDTPVTLRIVGEIRVTKGNTESYDKDHPLTLSTPAEFYANVEKTPAIIEAKGNQFIKVVADRQLSGQHLVARARRVTIRLIGPASLPNMVPRIEIIGEAKVVG
jgi:hypothetical protein